MDCLDLGLIVVAAWILLLLPLLLLLLLVYIAFPDLHASSSTSNAPMCTIVALSYRGLRTSRGRPLERGSALGAAVALNWVSQRFPQDLKLVF